MTTRWLIILSLSLSALTAMAKEQPDCDKESPVVAQAKGMLKVTSKLKECPAPPKLTSNLCSSISGMIEDHDPDSFYVYEYQRIIYEASCVDYENDSEKEISRKVNIMWKKHGSIKCNSPHFNVSNGNIIKFAVSKQFRQFLEEAAQVWKIDLNEVDETDGRTVLDYLQREIDRRQDGASKATLKQYFKLLRDAGAKYKSEL